ncbi:hypothetical protein CC80DRAFT_535765 [Byssothecium circinans]|uniref:Uncharacterized protein n=1 Tax=Byssothecium circinans TaxID=147558 RepID=A0A6A5TSP9_9PLEO|nr:hypothetical protein CC80DRAFT_535765 [Byssothecium circinans]
MSSSQANTELQSLKTSIASRNLLAHLTALPPLSSQTLNPQTRFPTEHPYKLLLGTLHNKPIWIALGTTHGKDHGPSILILGGESDSELQRAKLEDLGERDVVQPFRRLWERTSVCGCGEKAWRDKRRGWLKSLAYWYFLAGVVERGGGEGFVVPGVIRRYFVGALGALGEGGYGDTGVGGNRESRKTVPEGIRRASEVEGGDEGCNRGVDIRARKRDRLDDPWVTFPLAKLPYLRQRFSETQLINPPHLESPPHLANPPHGVSSAFSPPDERVRARQSYTLPPVSPQASVPKTITGRPGSDVTLRDMLEVNTRLDPVFIPFDDEPECKPQRKRSTVRLPPPKPLTERRPSPNKQPVPMRQQQPIPRSNAASSPTPFSTLRLRALFEAEQALSKELGAMKFRWRRRK